MNDLKKSLLYQALQYANSLYFEQTGFLHYCYESIEKPICIPIYENFLFALLLMEKKEKDLFLRAQNLLKRLFSFQHQGGFSSYIHEYGDVNVGLCIRLLPVFFALEKRFFSLFDSSFQRLFLKAKEKLEKQIAKQSSFSFLQELNYHCYQQNHVEVERLLEDKSKILLSPTKMKSQILIAVSMLDKIPNSMIDWLQSFYDQKLQRAVHPYFDELSLNGSIVPTIYSEVQKLHFGVKTIPTFHGLMQLPLVQDLFFEPKSSMQLDQQSGKNWQVVQVGNMVATNIEKVEPIHPRKEKGYHPFCLHYFNGSLVTQCSHAKIKMNCKGEQIKLELQFEKLVEAGEVFLKFYIENDPSLRCKIEGETSSVFYPNERIQIVSDQVHISMQFATNSPVVGHVGFGKRPSEISENHIDRTIYFRARENIEMERMDIYLECAAKELESSATAMACMPLST